MIAQNGLDTLVHQPKRVNVPSSIPSMLCMDAPRVCTMQNGSMLFLLPTSSFVSPLLLKSFFLFLFVCFGKYALLLCLMLEPGYETSMQDMHGRDLMAQR